MQIEEQDNAELARLGHLIEHIPTAMLTAFDDEGALVSKPMSPLAMDAEGALWFFTDRRSEKVAHLAQVNISFSDAGSATYVSLSGHAQLDGDRTRMARLWTALSRPWFPEGPQSLNLILLKFIPDKAEYWDAPGSKMVRMFALAASVLARKPVGMGEHDSLNNLKSNQNNLGEIHEHRTNRTDSAGTAAGRGHPNVAPQP